MANPIPFVVQTSGAPAAAPEGAVPIALYSTPDAVSPVITALIAAGFGTAGQVLTTNPGANGFVWTTPA